MGHAWVLGPFPDKELSEPLGTSPLARSLTASSCETFAYIRESFVIQR